MRQALHHLPASLAEALAALARARPGAGGVNRLAAALQQAWPAALTGLQAALFIVATVIVFIDEARTPALVSGFHGLWFVMLVKWSWDAWRDWRKGLLSMPLSQLHRHIAQGGVKRTSLLEVAAMFMGIAAMVILTVG